MLGGAKADSAFDELAEMTANDKSPFARRCGAYALGLLGDQRARPVLEKALKDPNNLVSNNAEAALTMLAKVDDPASWLPSKAIGYIIGEHYKAVATAAKKSLPVNTHIYGVDNEYNLFSGGFLGYTNDSKAPQPGPIHLGNFGTKKPDFILIDEQGREREYELREQKTTSLGKWALWWKPNKPIQPAQAACSGTCAGRPSLCRRPTARPGWI